MAKTKTNSKKIVLFAEKYKGKFTDYFYKNSNGIGVRSLDVEIKTQEEISRDTGGSGLAYTDGEKIVIPNVLKDEEVFDNDVFDKKELISVIIAMYEIHEIAHSYEDVPTVYLNKIRKEIEPSLFSNITNKSTEAEIRVLMEELEEKIITKFKSKFGKTLDKDYYSKYTSLIITKDFKERNFKHSWYNSIVDIFIENHQPHYTDNKHEHNYVKEILTSGRNNVYINGKKHEKEYFKKIDATNKTPEEKQEAKDKSLPLNSKLTQLTQFFIDPRFREEKEKAGLFNNKHWKEFYRNLKHELDKMYNLNLKLYSMRYGELTQIARKEQKLYSMYFNEAAVTISNYLLNSPEYIQEQKEKEEKLKEAIKKLKEAMKKMPKDKKEELEKKKEELEKKKEELEKKKSLEEEKKELEEEKEELEEEDKNAEKQESEEGEEDKNGEKQESEEGEEGQGEEGEGQGEEGQGGGQDNSKRIDEIDKRIDEINKELEKQQEKNEQGQGEQGEGQGEQGEQGEGQGEQGEQGEGQGEQGEGQGEQGEGQGEETSKELDEINKELDEINKELEDSESNEGDSKKLEELEKQEAKNKKEQEKTEEIQDEINKELEERTNEQIIEEMNSDEFHKKIEDAIKDGMDELNESIEAAEAGQKGEAPKRTRSEKPGEEKKSRYLPLSIDEKFSGYTTPSESDEIVSMEDAVNNSTSSEKRELKKISIDLNKSYREIPDLKKMEKEIKKILKGMKSQAIGSEVSGNDRQMVERYAGGSTKVYKKYKSNKLGNLTIFVLYDNSGSMSADLNYGENTNRGINTRKDYSMFFIYALKELFSDLGVDFDIRGFSPSYINGWNEKTMNEGSYDRRGLINWEVIEDVTKTKKTKKTKKDMDSKIAKAIQVGTGGGTNLISAFIETFKRIKIHQNKTQNKVLLVDISDGASSIESQKELNYSTHIENLMEDDDSISHLKLNIGEYGLLKYFGFRLNGEKYYVKNQGVWKYKNKKETQVANSFSIKEGNKVYFDGVYKGNAEDYTRIDTIEDFSIFMQSNIKKILNDLTSTSETFITTREQKF